MSQLQTHLIVFSVWVCAYTQNIPGLGKGEAGKMILKLKTNTPKSENGRSCQFGPILIYVNVTSYLLWVYVHHYRIIYSVTYFGFSHCLSSCVWGLLPH